MIDELKFYPKFKGILVLVVWYLSYFEHHIVHCGKEA